ncbi:MULTISPECIES: hypothetical protein [unclassified Streptomyces]|uniref:hypothetical protein n=1 Tax=unclassified Streptomyces TaxID=2593676 RepID=UPI0033A2584F
MSTRKSSVSRTFATMTPLVAAVLIGGVLTAGPASAIDTGTVIYSGTVTCDKEFPAPSKSVPKTVKLDSDEDDATVNVHDLEGRRATYGPVGVQSPLDSKFDLKVTVSCKAPKKKAVTFTRTIPLTDLTENEEVTLNIK